MAILELLEAYDQAVTGQLVFTSQLSRSAIDRHAGVSSLLASRNSVLPSRMRRTCALLPAPPGRPGLAPPIGQKHYIISEDAGDCSGDLGFREYGLSPSDGLNQVAEFEHRSGSEGQRLSSDRGLGRYNESGDIALHSDTSEAASDLHRRSSNLSNDPRRVDAVAHQPSPLRIKDAIPMLGLDRKDARRPDNYMVNVSVRHLHVVQRLVALSLKLRENAADGFFPPGTFEPGKRIPVPL